MVATHSENLNSVLQQEKEIRILLEKKRSGSSKHLTRLLALFRSTCQDVLLQNFAFAQKKNVENRLWDVHGQINRYHRSQLKRYGRNDDRRKRVERRKAEKSYLEFMTKTQRFYRTYLQSLHSHFKCFKVLEAIANKMVSPSPASSDLTPMNDDIEHLLSISCHQTLIRLGDLSRWRETQLQTKSRNWGPAKAYYNLASRVNPASAESNNQLAVIALQDMNHLETVYHLYLTIVAEEPHPCAKENLEIGFRKLEATWSKDDIEKKIKPDFTKLLDTLFVRLHICCYKGDDLEEIDKLEDDMLKQFDTGLKERVIGSRLIKMVLINIAAVFGVEQQLREFRQESPNSPGIQHSRITLQRLNVKIFSVLLSSIRSELERHDHLESTASIDTQKSEYLKLSAGARRLLPALRLYSSRMMADVTALFGLVENVCGSPSLKEMWKIYAKTMTLLNSVFPPSEAIGLDYLLDEDECTLGFSPFRHENTKYRYYMKDGLSPKPRKYDVSSNQHRHDDVEMSNRVHDLLADSLAMQNRKVIPIIVSDNGRGFRFLEDAASYPSGNRDHQKYADVQREEITHIEGTIFPQSDLSASVCHPASRLIDTQGREVTHVDETTFSHSRSIRSPVPALMNIDSEPNMIAEEIPLDPEADFQHATLSGEMKGEETSYGLLGSATLLEHLEEPADRGKGSSVSRLPSRQSYQHAPETKENERLESSRNPPYLQSSAAAPYSSQNGPVIKHQQQSIRIPSSNSIIPTPTFEQSSLDCLPVGVVQQHPSVGARQVQKVLDDSKFISSNIFPNSTCEPNQDG